MLPANESITSLKLTDFLNVSRERSDLITDSARLLIQDSYYRTDNIDRWTYNLQSLTARISEMAKRYANIGQSRPNVIIMGSPVAFPNYKIPFLVNSVGLNLLDTSRFATIQSTYESGIHVLAVVVSVPDAYRLATAPSAV